MTDTLAQYGVKGMHWGVRREGTRGSTPPSARAPKSQSILPAKKAKTADREEEDSPRRPMTEAELRSAINRIKLEREYANLMAPPPREKSEMRKIAEAIVKDSVKSAGTKVLTGALTKLMTKILPPGLREAPKKSKTDEVAEKVLKGLKGDQKKGKDDDGGGKKSSGGGDAPKKPSGGGDKPSGGGEPARRKFTNERGKSSFGSLDDEPQVDEHGFVKPTRPYTPRRSRSSRGDFKSPFGGQKKEKSSGSDSSSSHRQDPPVHVPPATVFSRDRMPTGGSSSPRALPKVPNYRQGRPGSSGSRREYDNDESSTSSRSSSYRQGRPGSTDPLHKKRRKWFGHDGVTQDDILALIASPDDTLAHHGVKGMHWGSRKPTYRKISPQGVSEGRRPKLVVKPRGIAGHIPVVGRKLSRRKTQRLIDELDLNFRLKDVERSEKPAVLNTVGEKARIKYYQDKTARKKR